MDELFPLHFFPNTFNVHECKFTFTFEADDVFTKATEGKVHIVFVTITEVGQIQ